MTINRRDFLKLSSLLTASTILQPGLKLLPTKLSTNPDAKNVLIFLFDAFSATNINFYGYPRETMPNLTRLLDRATVYQNHYASSNFTTPGTASLLTGRFPWEHLALKVSEAVSPSLTNKSIFSFFEDYFKLSYTHNPFVEYILEPFYDDISRNPDRHSLFLEYSVIKSSQWFTNLMTKDPDTAVLFKSRLVDPSLDGYLYSLIFPSLLGKDKIQIPPDILELFPRGVPEREAPFLLEDAIDWSVEQASSMSQPFLGYFHFLPPHRPYNTREEFIDTFMDDGYTPPEKPKHPVIIQHQYIDSETEQLYRRHYDEFLLYVDAEFHRLFTELDNHGILDNTLVVFTSDHGEMFERRSWEHNYPYLYEPLVKIPLIIFQPGQTERIDIHAQTSCVDLLPSLLHYTGHTIPADLPGQILPPYSDPTENISRTIYAMDGRWNLDHSHLETTTLMMLRDNKKIIRYSNYKKYYLDLGFKNKIKAMQTDADPYFEAFDLENDPEELNNLALTSSPEIQTLADELEQFYREKVEFPEI
jgi:arylsulfatase A-like enzyme